ncbi:zinc-dependent alcohol dehydrogenase [Opitutus terrae]|uniref:Alcohol dehydrogenase GroES domain protein n=1 Tax=Opitutus terrae (strain DSM 11246 / JCM 15787 / PB90-1) TaxID=452637 RepID=B1ZMA3_OPITP|nr:zinc-dependent alcohol dehydrogenase [Opitutus terrae]ACB73356.1 Alcohol dehydrogenase GroES domain protein [Opitutus terrae PB90-1]
MKAVCWMGKKKMEVQEVDDPKILNPRDCIVRITSTAICGSDLHLYDGYMPTLEKGDILGHEFMGEVVEVGPRVAKLKVGDRVVVPFTISCGGCAHCARQQWSLCDNTNPNAWMAEKLLGYSAAGLYGYSHLTGGYAGGQAQYARVPFADVGPLKIENDLTDEQVLFISDIFPTGYMAAENCDIQPGQTVVAVWGCGPVGQFAIRSALLMGAAKVYAIDNVPERLAMAEAAGAIPINDNEDVLEKLRDLTGGRGPDAAIDAVGMEAHGSIYDDVKQSLKLETDRPYALRQAMRAVRKGGVLSIPGVYGGFIDKVPFGAVFNKGVTLKMGQTHVQRYMPDLLRLVEEKKIDPSFVITHRVPLSRAPEMYETFAEKRDGCIKVVLDPAA